METLFKDKYSIIISLFSVLLCIISGNYLNTILFLLIYLFMIKKFSIVDLYDKLFYTLILTATFDYMLHLPYMTKIYFFHIFLSIFTLINLYKLLKKEINIKVNKKIIAFYGFWFFYILLSFIWAKNKGSAIKFTVIYVIVFMFLFNIILYVNSMERFNKLIDVIIMMFFISTVIGILAPIFSFQLPGVHYYDRITQYRLTPAMIAKTAKRPVAFFYNTNNFATYITMFLPLLVYKTFIIKTKKRYLYVGFILLGLLNLIFSTSRFNIISLAFMLIVASIIYTIKSKNIKKALLYCSIIIITFIFVIFLPKFINKNTFYSNKINKIGEVFINLKHNKVIGKDGSENVRVTLYYDITKAVFKDGHLLGFGVGNSADYLKKLNNTHKTYNPHGWIFEILGDFGVIIFVLYSIYFILLVKKLNYLINSTKCENSTMACCLLLSLAGFIFGSLSPSSITYFLPHWLLFGVIISFITINSVKFGE